MAALLTALTVLLGVQFLRVYFSTATFVVGDGGLQPYLLGAYFAATLLLGFLAPMVRRWIGARGLLGVAAAGLAVLRVAEQAARDPRWDLGLSTAAVVCLLWFFPALIAVLRQEGHRVAPLGMGLFLGLAGDAALRAALWSLDLSWHEGTGALAGAGALGAAQLLALAGALSATVVGYVPPREHGADGPGSALWPLVILGPVWFLELEVFQNFGRLAQLAGWTFPAAALWVQLSNAVAVLAYGLARERLGRRGGLAVLASGGLAAWLLLAMGGGGWPAAAAWMAGHAGVAVAVAAALALPDAIHPTRRGLGWTSVWHGLGMVGLVALLGVFYGLFQPAAIFAWAAGAVTLVAALATLGLPDRSALVVQFDSPSAVPPSRLALGGGGALVVVVALAALPAIQWFNWKPPDVPAAAWAGPVRVITYNLRHGVDLYGGVALEEQARVLEAAGADVIVLQEVTRGWIIGGGADMVAWLSRRLGMPVVFGPTVGDIWGNAVLTRLPVTAVETGRFALRESPVGRGYVFVRLETVDGPLHLLATHFAHERASAATRRAEAADVLAVWGGRPRTLFVGDLNATPDSPEIQALLRAGFVDGWAAHGVGDGFTVRPDRLTRRIDYILHTPDLPVTDVRVLDTAASDHLPVVGTVRSGR